MMTHFNQTRFFSFLAILFQVAILFVFLIWPQSIQHQNLSWVDRIAQHLSIEISHRVAPDLTICAAYEHHDSPIQWDDPHNIPERIAIVWHPRCLFQSHEAVQQFIVLHEVAHAFYAHPQQDLLQYQQRRYPALSVQRDSRLLLELYTHDIAYHFTNPFDANQERQADAFALYFLDILFPQSLSSSELTSFQRSLHR